MTAVAPPTRIDRPQLLSLIWIFLLLNFIYCDVVGLHDGAVLSNLLKGEVGPLEVTPTFLLAASVLMEVPMAMVLVSRLAPRMGSRVANVVAASFMIVVQASSFLVGVPSLSYLFFSAIEIAGLAVIIVLAIRWKTPATA